MTDGAGLAPDLPEPDDATRALFGSGLDQARRYAAMLADAGVREGHIGPREVPRLWERHLVNSALVGSLIPRDVRVVDVGSGAGLPGLVLAISRPDLRVDLVEPMLRRTRFLERVVGELDLADRVRVVRGRAEEPAVRHVVGDADWATARAVAPLDRLVRWTVPLLAPGGTLLALKGESAQAELQQHLADLRRAGVADAAVHELVDPAGRTWVIVARAAARKGRR